MTHHFFGGPARTATRNRTAPGALAVPTHPAGRRLGVGPTTASRKKRGEGLLWQRRFWEHTIRNDRDFAAHCDYVHWNPVKHGLAPAPKDWPHSTFHRFVEEGLLPANWGSDPPRLPENVGRE